MRSRDVRAMTIGLLFIAATATSLIATAFLGSLLDGPGFLATVSRHQDRMLTAALFQLIAAFTCAAIAVALYPVLREHAAGMALGAVAFRLIEGVFYALSAAGTMILVSLSGQLMAGASANASADLVRDLRDASEIITRVPVHRCRRPQPRCHDRHSTGSSARSGRPRPHSGRTPGAISAARLPAI